MINDILFTEKQQFTQWWLWLILIGIDGLFVSAFYVQIINGKPFGDNPMSNSGIYFGCGLAFLITLLFRYLSLKTIIKKDGIYVKFLPFHISFKKYSWDKIQKAYVRQYKPISEYGGWGLRYGFFGEGKALNVSGNQGLQIVFSNNSKLLIGTQKPNELIKALEKIENIN